MKEPLPRILVYQNDDCTILTEYLSNCGFDIINSSKEDIMQKIKVRNYDICLIDNYEVNKDKLYLLKEMHKADDKMPIIFLSDIRSYAHKINAFKAGTDDYIEKPYNIEELVCRIKALLKRCGIKARIIEEVYKIGNYVFNTKNKTLTIDGVVTNLNDRQSKILALLCAYKGEVLLKSLLIKKFWVDDNYYNKRSLDVHMCVLRNTLKLDKNVEIKTIRGAGYSLIVNEK